MKSRVKMEDKRKLVNAMMLLKNGPERLAEQSLEPFHKDPFGTEEQLREIVPWESLPDVVMSMAFRYMMSYAKKDGRNKSVGLLRRHFGNELREGMRRMAAQGVV